MRLIDHRGDFWIIPLYVGSSIVRQVDAVACQMMRDRGTWPHHLVATRAEIERAASEEFVSCYVTTHDISLVIAGIPVVIEERSQEMFLNGSRRINPFRFVFSSGRSAGRSRWMEAVSVVRPPTERPPQRDEALAWVRDTNRQVDEMYRRHGGTQTPPSKRPPSKLHPLVQLDEAIGRNMEMGDET